MTKENNAIEIRPQEEFKVIDAVNLQEITNTMNKINKFQQIVQQTLKQNLDFGIIPGSKRPTLLKPGAEKIMMLMGLRTEFEMTDSTRDFEKGFMQYVIKCKIYKNDLLITEGIGSCNSKENKYKKADACSIDNTILKMAKKRALVDATLLVASLSDIFTQDIEDMDLQGNSTDEERQYTDQDGTISNKQAKRMFALAIDPNGKKHYDIIKEILDKKGYSNSNEVKKMEYDEICDAIEKRVSQKMDQENN